MAMLWICLLGHQVRTHQTLKLEGDPQRSGSPSGVLVFLPLVYLVLSSPVPVDGQQLASHMFCELTIFSKTQRLRILSGLLH